MSLALPMVSPEYDHETDVEPFGLFLTNYDVRVPADVFDELRGLASEADGTILGDGRPPATPTTEELAVAAADVVTAAEGNGYVVSDPYENSPDHDEAPSWGLDDGETAAIVQANYVEASGMMSDDFKSKTAILRHLDDEVEWLSSFDLLVEMWSNDLFSKQEGRSVANTIAGARDWKNQPYVQNVIFKHF